MHPTVLDLITARGRPWTPEEAAVRIALWSAIDSHSDLLRVGWFSRLFFPRFCRHLREVHSENIRLARGVIGRSFLHQEAYDAAVASVPMDNPHRKMLAEIGNP